MATDRRRVLDDKGRRWIEGHMRDIEYFERVYREEQERARREVGQVRSRARGRQQHRRGSIGGLI